MPDSVYARRLKRALDAGAALVGLVVVGPLMLLVAAAIKLLDPGPVLFRHQRVGLRGKPFAILKFRTMRAGAEKEGPQITSGGDARVTRLGRLLRRTKVDELPQLVNVLRGDMSLVGPRPEVRHYVELFRDDYDVILSVRPGITDYAAIKYRDEEATLGAYQDAEQGYVTEVLPDKIALYHRYISEVGFATDARILLATLAKVLVRH